MQGNKCHVCRHLTGRVPIYGRSLLKYWINPISQHLFYSVWLSNAHSWQYNMDVKGNCGSHVNFHMHLQHPMLSSNTTYTDSNNKFLNSMILINNSSVFSARALALKDPTPLCQGIAGNILIAVVPEIADRECAGGRQREREVLFLW